MALFLGIDLGTSYFKVGLFDASGAMRGLGRIAVEKDLPAPGFVELPVARFLENLRRGLKEALEQAGARPSEIAGISYSSQANTFVLLDERDEALTPLVVWTDVRGEPFDAAMAAFSRSELFGGKIGFVGMTGSWAVAKWHWFRSQRPEIWRRMRRVMTISDYLTFKLTGEPVGDASTAAFLGLYDLTGEQWWSEALRVFEIDGGWLSKPLRPGATAGRTGTGAQAALGLPAGVPVAVGGLDHHVAALGAGVGRFASTSISTGTVLAALTIVPQPTPRAECYHGPHFERGRFYRLAFDGNGAGQLEEYQRRYAPRLTIPELLARAELPPDLRATNDHGREVRALLEKIAEGHRTLVRHITGEPRDPIVATGGGARSPLWVQIKADTIGVPIVTTACAEPACLGAAMLGSVAAGAFKNLGDASAAMVHQARRFEPRNQAGSSRHD